MLLCGRVLFERLTRDSSLLRLGFVIASLLAGLLGNPAFAQNFNATIEPLPDSVTVRPRPDYDAIGIQTGAFVLKPSASLTETYNDNIYATKTNRKSDFITEIQPKLQVDSLWSRHALNFAILGDLGYHASATTEDYTNIDVHQGGRLDIGGSGSLTEEAYFQRYEESRTSVDDPRAMSPVKVDLTGGALEYRHEGGSFFGSLRGTISDSNFHNTVTNNGAVVNNHDRDRTVGTGALEMGYDSGGLIRPFVQVTGMKVDFKQAFDDFGLNRDSTGYAVNGGILFPVTALIKGRVFAGYIAREFQDLALADIHTIGYGGTLLWSPNRSTAINLQGLRTVEETTLNGASGALSSSVNLAIDLELRENLLLHGEAGYRRARFVGIARTDDNWAGGIGLTYLMNHRLRATLAYDYSSRSVNDIAGNNDYSRNRVNMTVRVQL